MSDNVNHITPGVEHNGNYATYLRKSKDDQMNSIEAQRKEINHFLNGGSWRVIKNLSKLHLVVLINGPLS